MTRTGEAYGVYRGAPRRLAPARVEPTARRGVTEECRRDQPNEAGWYTETTRSRSHRAEGEMRRD